MFAAKSRAAPIQSVATAPNGSCPASTASASRAVVARHKPPFSTETSKIEPLHLSWPHGVISLSHVALPFAPDDPLYGQGPPAEEDALFLGQMAIQGERDIKVCASFSMRPHEAWGGRWPGRS